MIVHFLQYGMTPCMGNHTGLPKDWPQDHRWSSDWSEVTCESCLLGKETILTYMLSVAQGVESITCKRCGMESFNSNDIAHRYCGRCDVFHDDIWPPARKWWIENKNEPT